MGTHWYNINKWVRVLVSSEDYNFINRNRRAKNLPKSSLSIDEQQMIDNTE